MCMWSLYTYIIYIYEYSMWMGSGNPLDSCLHWYQRLDDVYILCTILVAMLHRTLAGLLATWRLSVSWWVPASPRRQRRECTVDGSWKGSFLMGANLGSAFFGCPDIGSNLVRNYLLVLILSKLVYFPARYVRLRESSLGMARWCFLWNGLSKHLGTISILTNMFSIDWS